MCMTNFKLMSADVDECVYCHWADNYFKMLVIVHEKKNRQNKTKSLIIAYNRANKMKNWQIDHRKSANNWPVNITHAHTH